MPSNRNDKSAIRSIDEAFREIFSNKTILYEFIQMFLSKLFDVHPIKESDIEIHNTDFLTSDLRSKRPDILFSVKIMEKELYIYILIEHQSYKDPNMPYRMCEYMSRIVGHIIRQKSREARRKSFKYPPIIPVVFYTGKGNWTIETDIRDKFIKLSSYEELVPSLKYIVIELSKIEKTKLLEFHTILSKLLYYLKPENIDEVATLFDTAMSQLFGSKYALFKSSIKTLMIGTGLSVEEADEVVEEISSGKEVKTMLRLLEKAKEEGLKQGVKEGLKQGRLKGLIEAKRQDVYEILEERFGKVPRDIKDVVENIADLEKLSILHRKSVTVKTIEEFKEILKNVNRVK